jgi:hypothetical protein
MSSYIVDGADLASVANAIRTKGGTSAQLAFPAGFVSAVEAISAGEEIFYTSTGIGYTKNTVNPATSLPESTYLYNAANDLETIEFPNFVGQTKNYTFVNCENLTSIRFLNEAMPAGSNFVRYSVASKLAEVQFGSLGHPAKSDVAWSQYVFGFFAGGTKPTITVFVNAETLADVPSNIKSKQPWNATGGTVVYRSSNTGEVLV